MTDTLVIEPVQQRVEIDEVTHEVIVTAPPVVQPLEITAPGPQGIPGPAGPAGESIVGPAGPAGEPGEPGDAALTYIHVQSIPSDTWVVEHNLGALVGVTVIDSAGTQVEGTVTYNSDSVLTISFAAGFSGRAILS